MNAPVVLASASPRRRELLARLGLPFEVVVADVEERGDAVHGPIELVVANAECKAKAVAQLRPEALVIGADTLVFLHGKPLGKPKDLSEAHAMLTALSGQVHEVVTGVCIVRPGGQVESFSESSRVHFNELDPMLISHYLALTQPLDKAGAYGIQDHGHLIIKAIEGAVENVMGLPLAAVAQRLGLEPKAADNPCCPL